VHSESCVERQVSVRCRGRMPHGLNRRAFLAGTAGLTLPILSPMCRYGRVLAEQPELPAHRDLPRLDLHVHLDNSTIDRVLELSVEREVKFGIVEHAGTKENKYPVVLDSDEALRRYLAMLEGKPVFRGVQAEWIDWANCFSIDVLAQLDYVLMDTMTFPGNDGGRVKLWEPDIAARVDMTDREAFMDRYVDWYVTIIENQPIDILGNTSWLPAPLAPDYDKFWTPQRIGKVAAAAVKHRVAFEISSGFQLPTLGFLQVAKAVGVKFCFGTNGRYPNMGKLDFSLAMAQKLGLKQADLFTPAPDGQKAVQRWSAR